MKFALIITLFTLFSGSVFADFSDISGADMVCVSSGAAYFFDFNEDTMQPEAIWQTDTADAQEGFLLIRIQSEKLSCDFCYDINAGLSVFGSVVPLRLKMRSESDDINLAVSVTAEDEEFTVKLDCREL